MWPAFFTWSISHSPRCPGNSQSSCISFLDVIITGYNCSTTLGRMCVPWVQGYGILLTATGTSLGSCGMSELSQWKLVAVELVDGFSDFQTCVPEHTHPFKVGTCPKDWPSRGEITFKNYRWHEIPETTPLSFSMGWTWTFRVGKRLGLREEHVLVRTNCIYFFGVVCLNLYWMSWLSHIREMNMSAGFIIIFPSNLFTVN